jgi:flagellar L-ring protein precursor FlgH
MRAAKLIIGIVLALQPCWLAASKRAAVTDNLAKYIDRVSVMDTAAVSRTPGSCWSDTGRLANLSSDYKAAKTGDLVTILVVQDVTATNSGSVSSDRSFKAASGVDSLPGKINTGGAASLLGLHSAETLSGKAQASSASTLRTTLAGTIVAVLPSGNLVVEAERAINVNQERQNIMVRGVVRPGDIGPANTITSTAISNLELEIKGKGVISDGTRAPHPLLRMILRILNF